MLPTVRAAAAALEHYGLTEQGEGKAVLGENIAQTAQFVEERSAADRHPRYPRLRA
ncbi:MAG: hypothetical protein U1D30_02785 [Planctomycetota bacterium]